MSSSIFKYVGLPMYTVLIRHNIDSSSNYWSTNQGKRLTLLNKEPIGFTRSNYETQ